MPNRYIREAAIESDGVNALSWQGEVFFRRLLNRADDYGRFTGNLALLRAAIFPLQLDKVREVDISRLLLECEQAGLLFRYTAAAKATLIVNRWEQGRAKDSKYPPPPPDICLQMQTYVFIGKHMSPTPTPTPTPTPIPTPTPTIAPAAAVAVAELVMLPDLPSAPEPPAGRARNVVLDALAACGGSDPRQIPPRAWSGIAAALADIRAVCPEVCPAEIARRAAHYRTHLRDALLSPAALAKNWALCDHPAEQYQPVKGRAMFA